MKFYRYLFAAAIFTVFTIPTLVGAASCVVDSSRCTNPAQPSYCDNPGGPHDGACIPDSMCSECVCQSHCPSGSICIQNPLTACTVEEVITRIADIIFYIGLIVVPVLILLAAYFFMTSAGDPKKVTKAKDIILWAVVGLAVIFLAKGITPAIKIILGG